MTRRKPDSRQRAPRRGGVGLSVLTVALVAAAGCGRSPAVPAQESANHTIKYLTLDGYDEAPYEIVDGLVIVEGDISLGTPAEAQADEAEILAALGTPDAGAGGTPSATRPKALLDIRDRRQWDGGVIPFCIDPEFTPDERQQILLGVNLWNQRSNDTGVRWDNRQLPGKRCPSKWQSGVYFQRRSNTECTSDIGRKLVRRNDINLGRHCTDRLAVIVHEMGHSMGLRHEQGRRDRDDFVDVWSDHLASHRDTAEIFGPGQSRFAPIGTYDVDSVMQYESNAFVGDRSTPIPLPTFLDRHGLSLFLVSTSGASSDVTFYDFNRDLNWSIRTGGEGVSLDRIRVADVDLNGIDDLVTDIAANVYWSKDAASGWRPLAPGGVIVPGPSSSVVVGQFDGYPGSDALRISGTEWTLYSSSGTVRSVTRETSVYDAHPTDEDRDGNHDVLVVLGDGSWAFAVGPDVLGPLVARTSRNMGVTRILPVSLLGIGLDVVAVRSGRLVVCRDGSDAFEPLLVGPAERSLGSREIADVWFFHLNRPGTMGEPIDLLTWENGSDGTGAVPGTPIYVTDIGSPAESPITAAAYSPFLPNGSSWRTGVDLRSWRWGQDRYGNRVKLQVERRGIPVHRQSAEGSPELGIITHAHIEYMFDGPAESDVHALGAYYQRSVNSFLTDRYPISPTRSIFDIDYHEVDLGERFELQASFMSGADSSPRLRTAEVVWERLGADGLGGDEWRVQSRHLVNFPAVPGVISLRAAAVVEAFVAATPGNYRVQIRPVDPPPPAGQPQHTATWEFFVRGSTCGDGFIDPLEQCDDGNLIANDGCEPTCWPSQRCGDGVVDAWERCDDGNLLPGDGCEPTCTPTPACGDGHVDAGEGCDDGNQLPNDGCFQCQIEIY